MAAAPLISPAEMSGQALGVVFCHISLAVSQASAWPLFPHSSHLVLFTFQYFSVILLLEMLFQHCPHFNLPVSKHLIWSQRRVGFNAFEQSFICGA